VQDVCQVNAIDRQIVRGVDSSGMSGNVPGRPGKFAIGASEIEYLPDPLNDPGDFLRLDGLLTDGTARCKAPMSCLTNDVLVSLIVS